MLQLRPYKEEDAKTILQWTEKEDDFWKWSADRFGKYPLTAEDMNQKYDAFSKQGNFFAFTALDEGKIVGHLIIKPEDESGSNLRFANVIVDAGRRGKGYGRQLLEKAFDIAFTELEAQTVTIGVFENNLSAKQCYLRVGFREAGPEKDRLYHFMGEEWNYIALEYTKDR